jgi:hypothetical protein
MKIISNIFKRKELPLVVTLATGVVTYIDKSGHVHIVEGTA